jgi:anti-sigma28 factor (negative regulator of flagellin synthesis)
MRVENESIGALAGSGSPGSVSPAGADARDHSIGTEDSFADTVTLSSASGLIGLAKSMNAPDRQSRIDALAAQVSSGSYQVNPQEVSRAVLKQAA